MKKHIPFLLTLSGGAIIRLTTVGRLMPFTPDEGYLAYITQTLIKDFHLIWIGVSNGSFGMFLGPYWQYILYPVMYLAKGDPVSMGYLSVFFGVASIVLLYVLGKEMFGKKVAIIATLLYSFSALAIYYDQKPYPSGVSFLSILLALSLFLTKKSKKWWVVLAFVYGMVFHIHLSLAPLILVAIYWAISHKVQLKGRFVTASFLALLIMFAPLIIFDYFHNASNVSAPFKLMLTQNKTSLFTAIPYHFSSLIKSFGRFFYLKPFSSNADELLWSCVNSSTSTYTIPPIALSLASFAVFIYFLFRKNTWRDDAKKLLAILGLAFVIPFVMFTSVNPIEYYLIGFYPLFCLIIALQVESLKGLTKKLAYVLLCLVSFGGIFIVITARTDYGIATKKRMVLKVMEYVQENHYSLQEVGDCHRYGGWRYIFSSYGKIPTKSDEEPHFGWLYPDELSDEPVSYHVIISEARIPSDFAKNADFVIKEGGFVAYIYVVTK